MWEVARLRNLLSGFVTTLKRLFESVMGTLFCLLLYILSSLKYFTSVTYIRYDILASETTSKTVY